MKILISLLFLLLATSCSKKEEKTEQLPQKEGVGTSIITAQDLTVDINGLSHYQGIIKTVHGNIVFKFYPQKAPNTVTRIIQLIQAGLYDGLTFHRVIPNFVVQTGAPNLADPNSGSGVKIRAEINDLRHIKGSIAMARFDNDPDSADSQFYIALDTMPHLDNKFTIFAQVMDGMDVVDKIVQGEKILSISLKAPDIK